MAAPLSLPHVFVVPPEEDHSPTWCCFDAALPPPPTPISADSTYALGTPFATHCPDDPLDSDFAIHDDHDYFPSDLDPPPEHPPHPDPPATGEDSVVIEVVKVRRHGQESPAPLKRSKTFKSRASKAFRSLKNVASRSKPPVQDIFSSSESLSRAEHDHPIPRPGTPSLSRRGPVILSQLFHSPSSDLALNATPPRTEPSFPSSSSTQSSPYTHADYSATSPSFIFLEPDDEAERRIRASSPSLSTRTFSNKRRFSILNLHRIFSFSASSGPSHEPEPTYSGSTTPRSNTPSMSNESTGPSTITSSSSGLDTPTEELHSDSQSELDSDEEDQEEERQSTSTCKDDESPLDSPDTSLEMRLDSLHFDSLSFDIEAF